MTKTVPHAVMVDPSIAQNTGYSDDTPADRILTAKGDLLTYSTETVKLPVGSDGAVLAADSTSLSGLSWSSGVSLNATAEDTSHLPTYTNGQTGTALIVDLNGALYTHDRQLTAATDTVSLGSGTQVGLAASSANGWSTAVYTALSDTAQTVKASAGAVAGYHFYNPNAGVVYLLLYNTTTPTVGTTTPSEILALAAGALGQIRGDVPTTYPAAIAILASTSVSAAAAPATGLVGTVWYA